MLSMLYMLLGIVMYFARIPTNDFFSSLLSNAKLTMSCTSTSACCGSRLLAQCDISPIIYFGWVQVQQKDSWNKFFRYYVRYFTPLVFPIFWHPDWCPLDSAFFHYPLLASTTSHRSYYPYHLINYCLLLSKIPTSFYYLLLLVHPTTSFYYSHQVSDTAFQFYEYLCPPSLPTTL